MLRCIRRTCRRRIGRALKWELIATAAIATLLLAPASSSWASNVTYTYNSIGQLVQLT
jgi:hypothetical protein